MRKPFLIAIPVVAGAVAVVVWIAVARSGAAALRSAAPTTPDLSDRPAEFTARIENAAHALSGGRPQAALRELGCLYQANGLRGEAEQVWRALWRAAPEARVAYYIAALREATGDLAEEEHWLTSTLRLAPEYAPAQLKLAELLLKQARFAAAAACYEKRLQLLPGDPYAQLGLARIAIDGYHDQAAAIARLETITRDHPEFSSAFNVLAELYAQKGDEARAEQLRRRGHDAGRFRNADDAWMEELDEYCYDPYQLQVLGGIRMQTGRVEASLPFFEKAVRLAPQDGPAHETLGDIYLQLHRLTDAARTLEEGIRVAPKTAALYSRLSIVLRTQGRPADAVDALRRGLMVLPDSADLYSDLGVALEESHRADEAITAYRTAIRLNPSRVEPNLNLGLCLIGLGNLNAARGPLLRVLELEPEHAKTRLALARLELDLGNLVAAGTHAQRLYEVHPDQPEAHEVLALWYLRAGAAEAKSGRDDEALRLFQAGLAIDPQLSDLHGNLGVLNARAGRYAAAVENFKSQIANAPTDPKAYLYLGQALLGAGQREEARTALERGLMLARQSDNKDCISACEALLRQ